MMLFVNLWMWCCSSGDGKHRAAFSYRFAVMRPCEAVGSKKELSFCVAMTGTGTGTRLCCAMTEVRSWVADEEPHSYAFCAWGNAMRCERPKYSL